MIKLLYTPNFIITPECVYCPELNLNLSCRDNDIISLSFYNDTLYCTFNAVHNIKHNEHCSEKDFLEVRLWTKEKILAMWIYNKQSVVNSLKKIQEKLISKCYIVENPIEHDKILIDLSDYNVVFLSEEENFLYLIKCNLKEFYNIQCESIIENEYERQYHIATPLEKKLMQRKRRFKQYYKEGDKVWNKKANNMDVAQYHLLLYGE